MSFQRYPNYKDSGVEWLGEVPAHWRVAPLKRNFHIVGGSTPKSETDSFWDGDILWATPSDLSKVDSFYLDETQRKITGDGLASCGTSLVPPGSIILSTRAPIGSLAIAAFPMCTNQGCKSLVPIESANSKYFAHLLHISSIELNIRGKGTTFLELSGDELGAFKAPVPPLPEQTQIAAFLDHETAKIDALIAEQVQLIALLKEKRQAVISHAVTRGLNLDAPMKDSGVKWLGEIPAHWACVPMKYLVRLQSGGTPSKERLDYWEGDIPWASAKDMKVDCLFDTEDHITEYAIEEGAAALVPSGAVVVVVRGMILAKTFPVALTMRDIAINQDLKAVMCGERLRPEFLAWYLRGTSDESLRRIDEAGHGTKALRMDAWTSLEFSLPSVDEQAEIAAFIGDAAKQFDSLIVEAGSAMTLLQERRAALISAAVTGKIDVRKAA